MTIVVANAAGTVTIRLLVFPLQIVAGVAVTEVIVGSALMVMAPLEEPTTEGLLAATRIRYPFPADAPDGIVAEMLPELAFESRLPILTGEANDPKASDNCAVYVLLPNVPALVNATEIAAPPAQNE